VGCYHPKVLTQGRRGTAIDLDLDLLKRPLAVIPVETGESAKPKFKPNSVFECRIRSGYRRVI
jgi:hypothetical protein